MKYSPARTALIGLIGLMIALGIPTQAQAQALPDAGALRQQLEPPYQPVLPARGKVPDAEVVPDWSLPDGERITVRRFRFEGHGLLPDARLEAAVQGLVGWPIGFADLQKAAQAVAQAYRDDGWIARAYLPRQDITDGVITIRIVEAVFGGVRLDGTEPRRIDTQRLLALVQDRLKPGDKVNVTALDEALLLADDLPGVSVSGALEPGQHEGETVLALSTTDKPAAAGEVQLDNTGARSTGATRVLAQGQLNSPLRRGDQLRAQAVLSEGSRYARLAWDTPVDLKGTRLGASVSALSYRLVETSVAGLDGKGRSTSVGLDVSRPLLRSRNQNLYLSAAVDIRRYNNQANGSTRSNYGTSSLTLGLNGNRYDDIGGGGATTASLALQLGRVALGSLDAGEDAARGGHFTKLQLSLVRQQQLAPRLAVTASVRGQYAGRTLDTSERLYLGGAQGVRAYPSSEGAGSQGHVASLELRYTPADRISASVFADAGRAHDPGGGATALKGVGAAVSWIGPNGMSTSLTVARRIGSNPQALPSGRDQDGSLVRNRVWAQVSLPF